MKTRVTTIAPEDTLHHADGIMTLGGLRHLPVVSGGALLGIVTHRDILRAPTTFIGFAADARAVLRTLTVRDVMTKEVVTIDADATVREAAERLLKHKVGCLPVLESGALVGIVTTSDLLHAIAGPYSVAADAPAATAGGATAAAAALGGLGG
jgi:acetoin utilization protein AcuB